MFNIIWGIDYFCYVNNIVSVFVKNYRIYCGNFYWESKGLWCFIIDFNKNWECCNIFCMVSI